MLAHVISSKIISNFAQEKVQVGVLWLNLKFTKTIIVFSDGG